MRMNEKVLKCDHSFKFPEHIAKIEDAGVFTSLFTVTNEYEEVLHQVQVPSKSLVYLKHTFKKVKEVYELCGHDDMPVEFFIDDVQADRRLFLQNIFDSLKVKQEIRSQKLSRTPTLFTDIVNFNQQTTNCFAGFFKQKYFDASTPNWLFTSIS